MTFAKISARKQAIAEQFVPGRFVSNWMEFIAHRLKWPNARQKSNQGATWNPEVTFNNIIVTIAHWPLYDFLLVVLVLLLMMAKTLSAALAVATIATTSSWWWCWWWIQSLPVCQAWMLFWKPNCGWNNNFSFFSFRFVSKLNYDLLGSRTEVSSQHWQHSIS